MDRRDSERRDVVFDKYVKASRRAPRRSADERVNKDNSN